MAEERPFGFRVAELVIGAIVGLLVSGLLVSGLVSRAQDAAVELGKALQQVEQLKTVNAKLDQAQQSLDRRIKVLESNVTSGENTNVGNVAQVVSILNGSPDVKALLEKVATLQGQVEHPVIWFSEEINSARKETKALGAHRACALSSAGAVHARQACKCIVERQSSAENTWILYLDLDENVNGYCRCRAVFVD